MVAPCFDAGLRSSESDPELLSDSDEELESVSELASNSRGSSFCFENGIATGFPAVFPALCACDVVSFASFEAFLVFVAGPDSSELVDMQEL
jgi:hypothetical protein